MLSKKYQAFVSILHEVSILILQGRYVVLASESHCICGCDVASPQSLRAKGNALSLEKLKEKLKAFEKQLTRKEWDDVYEMNGLEEERILCRHIENTFSKYWSLKEVRIVFIIVKVLFCLDVLCIHQCKSCRPMLKLLDWG